MAWTSFFSCFLFCVFVFVVCDICNTFNNGKSVGKVGANSTH